MTPKLCAANVLAGAAEAADHFVEHEQDAVRIADLAQPLRVSLGRHEAAARSGDRLDEARRDILGAVEGDEAGEIVGELDPVRAFALGEEVFLEMRVPHVRDARQSRPELATIVDEPRQRDAAEADAVIRAFARDEDVAPALSARLDGRQARLFIAVSTDSEPELTKKMRLRSPGVSSATRVASSNCLGCARRNGAQKSSSRNWAPTASAISLRPWPAETQKSPDDASMILSPRSFQRYIPSARTTICGSALKSRFGVNGIQYSSSEMRFDATCSWIVSSAWPIVFSFVGVRAGRASATPGRHMLGSTSNPYTFATGMRQPPAPFGGVFRPALRHPRRHFTTFREIPMRVGVPKEIKVLENRVGLVPGSVRELVAHGHSVVVEHNAGQGIGMDDDTYRKAGATVVATAAEVFAAADMIVKVKEPQAVERKMLRHGQILFTYLHLAPDPEQAADLVASGAVCIAYETVTSPAGGLAAARADVRSRGPDGRAGGRVLPREAARRARHAAGRRARRRSGQGRDPGRRSRRLARLPHRARHGRRSVGARPQRRRAARAVAAIRPSAQYGVLDARRRRESRDERGSRHRRRADSGRIGAQARLGRAREEDEARIGDRRRRDRPGRLLRDVAPDDARRSGLRRRRRDALLRGEHARRRAAHVDVRAQQRDAAVRAGARRQGLEEGARRRPASAQRPQRRVRKGDMRARGRGARLRVRRADEVMG